MTSGRITKRSVEAMGPAGPRDRYLWDNTVPGFGLKLTPRGARTYLFQYRDRARRTRRVTIGRHGVITADQARSAALQIQARTRLGENPAEEQALKRSARTVAAVAEAFLTEHVGERRKPRTGAEYRRLLECHAFPKLGRMLLEDIGRPDIARLHNALRKTPYQANRVLAVLSSLFTWAIRHGDYPGDNPCRYVEKFQEKGRKRFLSPAEMAALGTKLAKHEKDSPVAVRVIRMLALTGMRKNEVLTLCWDEVDFEAGVIRLSESKTGEKTVPLAAPALVVLEAMARLRQKDNPHVFPGHKTGGHFVGIQKLWNEWRAEAGLQDVRLHDLRHSFASVGASGGDSLLVLGSILGHRSPATTQGYAHLHDDPRKAAAERISSRIAASFAGEEAEVIPLRNGS